MTIKKLSACNTAEQISSFFTQLTSEIKGGGRHFTYGKKSYTANQLVLRLQHCRAKSDPVALDKARLKFEELDRAGQAKIANLTPFQRLIYRIIRALGNFFFRLKHGKSREEFLQEMRDKLAKVNIVRVGVVEIDSSRQDIPSTTTSHIDTHIPTPEDSSEETDTDEESLEVSTAASALIKGENVLSQIKNDTIEKYEVDQPLVIKQGGKKVYGHIVGTCMKAELAANLPGRFGYLLAVEIRLGQKTQQFQLAFASNQEASDPVSLGRLALQQMVAPSLGPLKEMKQIAMYSQQVPPFIHNQSLESRLGFLRSESEILKQLQKEQQELQEASEAEEAYALPEAVDLSESFVARQEEREKLGLDEKYCNMARYIDDLLKELGSSQENSSKKLQNSDTIAFADGKIVKAATEDVAKMAYQRFFLILKETYGTELARRIFGRYQLNKKQVVTLLDLKKAMVAIAMNVRNQDLRTLFEHIKADRPGELSSYKAGDLLFEDNSRLYMQIRKKASFDLLTSQEVAFLHSAFKTSVTIQKSPFGIADILTHLKNGHNGEDFLYGHDLGALELMETWNKLDLEHPTLAIDQHVGKSLAYLELKEGLIFPMPSVTTQDAPGPVFYKVAKSLPNKNDAVLAHILTPMNGQQKIFDGQKEVAFLAFRGTLPHPGAVAGGMSLYRDLHYRGIGRTTYDEREAEIQNMVEGYLNETLSSEVELRITGHSLGACDTQRALTSLLEKIAESPEGSPWRKLKSVVMTTFNAPRSNQSVNQRMKTAVKEINHRKIDVSLDLTHVRFFDKCYEDTIQKFGDILVGADHHGGTGEEVLKNAPNMKRKLVKMWMDDDQGLANGFLPRHSYRPFNKALCTVPYRMEVLNADIEKERLEMEKEMAGTFYWNENEMSSLDKVLSNLIWYTSWFGLRQPKRFVQAVLFNAPHIAGLALARLINGSSNSELDQARLQ